MLNESNDDDTKVDDCDSKGEEVRVVAKMSNLRTYFALVKAYMAINILLTPRSFVNGGYFFSPIAMIIATIFESFSSVRLVNVALELQVFSYPLLMQLAMGKAGLTIANVFLAIAHV